MGYNIKNRRSWIRLSIKEFLDNWKNGYQDSLKDEHFIIYYDDFTSYRLNLQTYDGEHIPLQHICNIEYLNGWEHMDFFNDDLDTYGEQPFGYYDEVMKPKPFNYNNPVE